MSDDHLSWSENSKKVLLKSRLFTIYESNRTIGAVSGDFIVLDAPDWVNVVVLLTEESEDSFLMVKQFRHGNSELTMEFPAGVIENGEDAEKAGIRELLEETGYKAEKLFHLGSVNPNPAFMSNNCYTYLARNPVKFDKQNLDEYEFMDFVKIPVKEVKANMGKVPYTNGIMLMAMFLFDRYMANKS